MLIKILVLSFPMLYSLKCPPVFIFVPFGSVEGHVYAFGESTALAIANMVLGLKEIEIRGEIRTNVDYTVDLLNAIEYRENKIHIGWLDSRIAMPVRAERSSWYLSVDGGALYKASTSSAAIVSDYVGYLGKGHNSTQSNSF